MLIQIIRDTTSFALASNPKHKHRISVQHRMVVEEKVVVAAHVQVNPQQKY